MSARTFYGPSLDQPASLLRVTQWATNTRMFSEDASHTVEGIHIDASIEKLTISKKFKVQGLDDAAR
jgi:hypothetical protein